MSRKSDYTNESQQRVLKVVLALAGHEITGLAPSDIAKHVGTTLPNVTRDLDNLRTAGLAEQIVDTGRWRLGPRLVQIANAFSLHINTTQRRLDEVSQRYTRQP